MNICSFIWTNFVDCSTVSISDCDNRVGSVADPGIKFGRGTWRAREREPITRVWGLSPQRGPGAEPLVWVRGKPPWSRKSFSFQTSRGSGRIASFCLFCKVNKPSIGQLYSRDWMNWAPNAKMWDMMGNISKTAEPSVFTFGTDLRVGKCHHILEGVRLPLLTRNN